MNGRPVTPMRVHKCSLFSWRLRVIDMQCVWGLQQIIGNLMIPMWESGLPMHGKPVIPMQESLNFLSATRRNLSFHDPDVGILHVRASHCH